MAMQSLALTFVAATSAAFRFNKPGGAYGFGGGVPVSATPAISTFDPTVVDNGDGTLTGTLNFSGPISGSALVTVYDT